MVFGIFQFGLAPGNLVFEDILAQPYHHFPLPDPLAQFNVEGNDLLADAAVHRHFRHGLDGSLAGKAFGLDGALQVLILHGGSGDGFFGRNYFLRSLRDR